MLDGPQGRSGRTENLAPTGIRSRTALPIVAIPIELPDPRGYLLQARIIQLALSSTDPSQNLVAQRCKFTRRSISAQPVIFFAYN